MTEPPYGAVAPGAALRLQEKKRNTATVTGVVSVLAFLAVLALAAHSWSRGGQVRSH